MYFEQLIFLQLIFLWDQLRFFRSELALDQPIGKIDALSHAPEFEDELEIVFLFR